MSNQTGKRPEITRRTSIAKKSFAVVAVMLTLAGIWLFTQSGTKASGKAEGQQQPPAIVRIRIVKADATVRDAITQNMSIEAVSRVQMAPRVSGRLERLHVKQGEFVKAGAPVATLEHTQQDADIVSTAAQLASAQADTARAYAEMINAKTNLDRYKKLVKEGFSTQQQLDTIETTFASTEAIHKAAIAKENQVAAELERVRSARRDYIMTSPMDGTVLSDYGLTAGAMISPSSPIIDIADLKRLKATLRIPELKIFSVKPGMPVILRFDALPSEEFRGEVTRIDPYVDPATRTSTVEIELDNATTGNRLRPGMFGQASIVEREVQNAIVVPAGAIMGSAGERYVMVEEDGVAKRRSVDLGIEHGNERQIVEGLRPGEKVIVLGCVSLRNGDKVEPKDENSLL